MRHQSAAKSLNGLAIASFTILAHFGKLRARRRLSRQALPTYLIAQTIVGLGIGSVGLLTGNDILSQGGGTVIVYGIIALLDHAYRKSE